MKSIFICLFLVIINCFNSDVSHYKQALSIILDSNEIKEYKLERKDFNVSSEIASFDLYISIFEDELKIENKFVESPHVVNLEKELLKLNNQKCGKIKIFFSEQKDNVFFAEVFVSKKGKLKYKNKPIFGEGILYMFKTYNGSTSLFSVKQMHYN